MITTKDLGSLNELMTFENWMAVKLYDYSKIISNDELGKHFSDMALIHIAHHEALLNYLKAESEKGNN
jgi:hypothetical protein